MDPTSGAATPHYHEPYTIAYFFHNYHQTSTYTKSREVTYTEFVTNYLLVKASYAGRCICTYINLLRLYTNLQRLSYFVQDYVHFSPGPTHVLLG